VFCVLSLSDQPASLQMLRRAKLQRDLDAAPLSDFPAHESPPLSPVQTSMTEYTSEIPLQELSCAHAVASGATPDGKDPAGLQGGECTLRRTERPLLDLGVEPRGEAAGDWFKFSLYAYALVVNRFVLPTSAGTHDWQPTSCVHGSTRFL
jgi:hypothetical protein